MLSLWRTKLTFLRHDLELVFYVAAFMHRSIHHSLSRFGCKLLYRSIGWTVWVVQDYMMKYRLFAFRPRLLLFCRNQWGWFLSWCSWSFQTVSSLFESMILCIRWVSVFECCRKAAGCPALLGLAQKIELLLLWTEDMSRNPAAFTSTPFSLIHYQEYYQYQRDCQEHCPSRHPLEYILQNAWTRLMTTQTSCYLYLEKCKLAFSCQPLLALPFLVSLDFLEILCLEAGIGNVHHASFFSNRSC